MSRQTKSLLISLAINLGAVCLVMFISNTFNHPGKTVVIDFTLLDSKGSKSDGNSKGTGQSSAGPVKQANPEPKPAAAVPSQPRIAKVAPVPAKPAPTPVTEPARTAPAAAPIATSAPVQATSPSGNAVAKSGGEAGTRSSGGGHGEGSGGSGSGRGRAATGYGTGASTDQLRKKYVAEQFEYIKKLIEKNIKYPVRALRMGWTGRVLVSFTIQENGHVTNMRIVNSSGHDLLDENIMETIKSVEPFPKPPVSASLKIPFDYRTEQ